MFWKYIRTCIKRSPQVDRLIQVVQNTSLTWLRKIGDKVVWQRRAWYWNGLEKHKRHDCAAHKKLNCLARYLLPYLSGFLLQSDRLKQVKTIEISLLGISFGWPRPLNRGDRLKQVRITVIKESNFRDFDNWPLNRGWPLNTVPLNTGSTVCLFFGN